MNRTGTLTRTAIMDAAESLILEQGFAGTPVDVILERTGVTKGAFFHHFPSKAALAQALVERYAKADAEMLTALMERAERLSRDPLQQVLIFVGLFEELTADMGPQPGCLFASYVYEAQLMTEAAQEVMRTTSRLWRERLGGKLREVAAKHPSRLPVDPESLADGMTVTLEGAFIIARMMREPEAVAEHLRHYRNYLELLFSPDSEPVVE
jgi:TetR/AcrR family transcriptional regulator, transcriptional repressor for nem operon